MTLVGSACAADSNGGDEVEHSLSFSPGNDDAFAGHGLWAVRQFNSAVHAAVARVKDEGQEGSFALYDGIQHELAQTGPSSALALETAAEEVLEHMLLTEEDQLAAKVYGFLLRSAELSSVPREHVPTDRLARCVTESLRMKSAVSVILKSKDADRKRRAYYFASAYNVVVNTHSFLLAAGGYPVRSLDGNYLDAIDANSYLVGTGEGDDGYLSDWIAEQTAGPESAREKNDMNDVVQNLRLALEEQQHVLE
jgi:hypothetical protein